MKTRFLAAVILLVLVFSAGSAVAARRITTVKGILGESATGKSMLKTDGESDKGYYFDPDSVAGKKILSICQTGKICVVRGVIKGHYILNAYYVDIGK
jgi:hypothetical protein